MRLTLQAHFNGEWHHAATLELKDDAAGFQGASIVDYDLDYFVTVASAEFVGAADGAGVEFAVGAGSGELVGWLGASTPGIAFSISAGIEAPGKTPCSTGTIG